MEEISVVMDYRAGTMNIELISFRLDRLNS